MLEKLVKNEITKFWNLLFPDLDIVIRQDSKYLYHKQ